MNIRCFPLQLPFTISKFLKHQFYNTKQLSLLKIKMLFLGLFFSFVLFGQQSGESILSLDGSWKFKTDPNNKGEEAGWFHPAFNDTGWDSLSVPGNWDLQNEYAHYAGKGWYRKQMNIPSQWRSKLVRLLFEAVNNDSKVWLNGQLLGSNNIGYLPFSFDISSKLKYDGLNTLVVCADNTFRRGALWNWGGIRRPVTVLATSKVYIDSLFVIPSVDLKDQSAQIKVRAKIRNQFPHAVKINGEVLITAVHNASQKVPFSVTMAPNQQQNIELSLRLSGDQVHLWELDDPFLYNCRVIVRQQNDILHQKTTRFGLRKVEVDKKNYVFKLNGVPLRLMGFNLVPDDRTTGNTLPLWRVKEDIDLMKSFGANMTRLTHLPMHQEMLDYLDEKGILVIEEVPLWGFDPLANKDRAEAFEWLHRLISNHYNHPSIIGWSVGNEIGFVPTVSQYVDTAIQVVKRIDTTRLGVMVNHTADRGKDDPIRFSDLGLINKYGTAIGSLADKIHAFHPEQLLFYAEYGYGQLGESLDADVNAKGMVDSIRFKPFLMGGSLWTFNDYRSSYPGTKEYSENRPWGIVDVFRQKKKAYQSFRREYAPVREVNVQLREKDRLYSAIVQILPRMPLDLPAYVLKDYTLLLKGYGSDGKIITGDFRSLPLIKPGDSLISEEFTWPNHKDLSYLQVELVSPLNYSVFDTTIMMHPPEVPILRRLQGGRTEINDISPNSGSIQLVLEKPKPGIYYKAYYTKDRVTKSTLPTRNHFIEIPQLPFNEEFQVSVSAINSFGESAPTAPKSVKVEVDAVAPIIYYFEPADKGFFVGVRTMSEDYAYVVQYTTQKGDYTRARSLQATTKGVLFVPGLQNGQTYYFRMQAIKQNNAHTAWSEEYTVTPDGQQPPPVPLIQGVLRHQDQAIVNFEPVKKAIGYIVQYRAEHTAQWKTADISASQIHHFLLHGLDREKTYLFRMQSVNQNGRSAFSEATRCEKVMNSRL